MADSLSRQVHRSPVARAGAFAWFVLAVVNLADIVRRGSGESGRLAFAGLLLVSVVVYLLAFRPALVVDAVGILVRNPLRDVRVPWAALTHVDATDVVRVHARDRVHRVWAVRVSNRARARAHHELGLRSDLGGSGSPGVRTALAGRTHADFVVEQVTERWARVGAGADPGSGEAGPGGAAVARWHVPGLSLLVVTALLVAAAAVWG